VSHISDSETHTVSHISILYFRFTYYKPLYTTFKYLVFTVSVFKFAGVEAFLTPFMDMFPRTLYKPRNRMIFVGVYCLLCSIIGLSLVSQVHNAYLYWDGKTLKSMCFGPCHTCLKHNDFIILLGRTIDLKSPKHGLDFSMEKI